MYPYNLEDDVFSVNSLISKKDLNDFEDDYEIDEDDYPSLDEYILELIREAILDECRDAKFYEELTRKANNPEDQQILREIYLDELKHRKMFEEIYYQLTGEKPNLICEPKQLNNSLTENYAQAILEELEAVKFYRKILFSFLSYPIRDWLYEIITDEQSHAQKLNYLYAKNLKN